MTMETTRRSALFRMGGGLAGLSGVTGAVLAACVPTGQGGPAPKEVSGTVEVLSWGEGDPAQPGWQARMTAFKARAPQLTVESTVTPFGNGGQAYDEKLIALAVAGTPPDVTFTDGTRLSNFAPRGIIRELDDFMARVKFDKGNYPKATWVANERKGKTIALPYRAQPYPFYVNHDLYAKAGLKPPTTTWTLDDLREQGRRLTAADGSQWGIGDLASTVSRYSMFIWAAGGTSSTRGTPAAPWTPRRRWRACSRSPTW